MLAGLPGAGKTAALRTLGVPALDLEGLAGHRGSAYGGLGLAPQPSQRAFDDDIDAAVADALDQHAPILVEDEGRFVGSLTVPEGLCQAIETAPIVRILASREQRMERLTRDYGWIEPRLLMRATQRLRRRLGGPVTDRAVSHFAAGRPEAAIATVLPYFDAAYEHRWELLDRPVIAEISPPDYP